MDLKETRKTESKIRTTRKNAGLTQAKVFELLGIPARTLQDWESGRRTPAPWLEAMVIREMERVAKNVQNR